MQALSHHTSYIMKNTFSHKIHIVKYSYVENSWPIRNFGAVTRNDERALIIVPVHEIVEIRSGCFVYVERRVFVRPQN